MDFVQIENLVKHCKCDDTQAKEALVKEFTPLIVNLASKTHIHGYDFSDLKNECFHTLFKCVDKYDTTSHRFVAYATTALKNTMYNLVRTSKRQESYNGSATLIMDSSLEHNLTSDFNLVENSLLLKQFNLNINSALSTLNTEEKELLHLIFNEKHTTQSYANLKNLTYHQAAYRKKSVIKKLRDCINTKKETLYLN